MKWMVIKPGIDLWEVIEADELWDTPTGGICFLDYVPLPVPEPVDLCPKLCKGTKKPCVRDAGHSGGCLPRLKPKFVKRQMTKVRGFAQGEWKDFQLIREDSK